MFLNYNRKKTFRCDTSTKTECATSYETSYEKYCSTIYKKVRSTLNILKFENEVNECPRYYLWYVYFEVIKIMVTVSLMNVISDEII